MLLNDLCKHLKWSNKCFFILFIFSSSPSPPMSFCLQYWISTRNNFTTMCSIKVIVHINTPRSLVNICKSHIVHMYHPVEQWFPTGGTRTPRGTQAHCRGYLETFNNHLCYVILFENHQHGGTHGMTNRLRGYTRQKRLGNTAVELTLINLGLTIIKTP